MHRQANYIVFQCYGNARVFYECEFALLSLSGTQGSEELSNTEIWIYTDNTKWFSAFNDCNLQLHFREIDTGTIKKWRGEIDFVHRVKIEVLRDLVKTKKGNILYVDSDVVFTNNIDKMLQNINSGTLYMHTMEGLINETDNTVFRKLSKFIRSQGNNLLNGKPLYEMAMWNAGVIGFNTQHEHLMDEVLTFTDQQYPKFRKHIIEQFAFSVYFQQAGSIKSAAQYVYHYWKLKEADDILKSFFDYFKGHSWSDLTTYSTMIQIPMLMQEKGVFYIDRSLAGKIMKKRWEPPRPDWPELLKQI